MLLAQSLLMPGCWQSLGLVAQAGSDDLPHIWEKLEKLGPVVGMAAAAVSAVAAVITFFLSYKLYNVASAQLASTNLASNRQHRYVTSLESVKFLRTSYNDLLQLYNKIGKIDALEKRIAAKHNRNRACQERASRLHEAAEKLVHDLLDSIEMFALSVNSTVLEIGFANDYLGSFIEDLYALYGSKIREERRTRETAYRQLELFLNDLFELRRAKYVISAQTIRCLQEDLASQSLLNLLQKPPFVVGAQLPKRSLLTPGTKTFSWAELGFELHRRRLGEEKYPIMRHSMVKQFRMAELKVVDEGHGLVFHIEDHPVFTHTHIDRTLQDFFRMTYKETNKQYPLIPDNSPEAFERYVRQTEVLKRWVAIRETQDRSVIVGHISCTDLAQDGRAVWDQLFDRIRQKHPKVAKHEYLMLQELYVRKEDRNAGIARMLIRHALWTIEEQMFPKWRKDSGEGARRPLQRIALTVVRHRGFEKTMENMYLRDGATLLLGTREGECSEIRFGKPKRTINLSVLEF